MHIKHVGGVLLGAGVPERCAARASSLLESHSS